MSSDASRPYARRRALLAIGSLVIMVISLFAGALLLPAPTYAASGADLTATLTNRMAVPGKRVSYVVVVTNHGPAKARRVRIDFFTSNPLGSVRWSNPRGRCIHSSRETACLFGTLKPGQTAKATISGIVSKKLKKGTAINNRVVLRSDTHLINTTNDTVTDNYRIGIPKVVPSPSPSIAPTGESKIDKITHVATDTITVTHTALLWSVVALAAAAVWFGVGLTLRARKRRNNPTTDLD